MKHNATFLLFGALCLFGCATEPPSNQTNNSTAGTPAATGGAPSTVAGSPSPATGGNRASGGAGAPASGSSAGTGGTASPAAGSGATAGASGGAATAGAPAAAGSGGSATPSNGEGAKGSFLAAYTLGLRDMCMSCHAMGGIFGSPDLSSPDRAYESLVDKDASTMMPGACGGKGKLVTPGNCETSIIYNKITQLTPLCGRHMPLSSDASPQLVPQAGIDALCEWIMAGAKKDM